ncbi:MAG: ATPase [Sphingomonadaceae bacterium]|nr:ATPase [Sphingomonadaceae bacterium]
MPQIDQLSESWFAISQLFWLAIIFGAVFFIIGLYMLPRVEATVDARDRKIADDLASAKAARDAADSLEEEYRTGTNRARGDAQGLIGKAKDKAAADTAKLVAKADAAIAEKMAAAEAAIAAARSQALAEVEEVASDSASALVARLSSAKISASDASGAVKVALNHG